MYWGRVVAAILAIMTLVTGFVSIGGSITVSVSTSTRQSQLPGAFAVDGLTVAGRFFATFMMALLPSLMAFNMVADVGEDDSKVPSRVLWNYRFWMIAHAMSWTAEAAGLGVTALFSRVDSVIVPLMIVMVAFSIICALLSIVLIFAFKPEPLTVPVVRTNKLNFFNLALTLFGVAGLLAGTVIIGSAMMMSAYAIYVAVQFFLWFLPLIHIPLHLKFRNDHGGFPRSHLVLFVLGSCCTWLACIVMFAEFMLVLANTSNGSTAVACLAGYGAYIASTAFNVINVVRQRKAAVRGYASLEAPPSIYTAPPQFGSTNYNASSEVPPGYGYPPPPTTYPMYQDDYHKAPQPYSVASAPPLPSTASNPTNAPGATHLNRVGEFDYDKRGYN